MGAIFILAVVFILCGVFALPFWWDDMKCYFNNRKLFLKRKSEVNKLVQLKLISSDSKEIEKFIENNIDVLSDKTISKLVSRIESIRLDLLVK